MNPTSLSKATRNATKQPQIYRFLNGDVKEPRRSTMQPVADALGIPVDALLDPKEAAATALRIWGGTAAPEVPQIAAWSKTKQVAIADAIDQLADMLESLPDDVKPIAIDQFRTLVHAPDSLKARAALARTLGVVQSDSQSKRHGT